MNCPNGINRTAASRRHDHRILVEDMRHSRMRITVAALAMMLTSVAVTAGQPETRPRLREGRAPDQVPYAYGGGEVVLELTVDPQGSVTRVERLRVTPPYADLVAQSAAAWQFDPAISMVEGRAAHVAAPVLVVAVFRPPTLYPGPAGGVPPTALAAPSPRLPRPTTLMMPAYPANAVGNGVVLIEIEMNNRAEPRAYRVLSPTTGFDSAAMDAVRSWTFEAPAATGVPDAVFVYAVVGFRAPLAGPRR